MTLRVVRLRPGDEQRLRTLRLVALQADPDAFYRTYAEEVDHPGEFWAGWLAREPGVLLVVEDEGRDVALGGLVPDRRRHGELAVVTFWVDPSVRGRGVGRTLLDALVARARLIGTPAVTLEVADGNAAAVKLYAAAGFEATGHSGAFGAPREHVTEHERRLVFHHGPPVRHARVDDLPAVAAVYAAGVRSRAATFRVDEPTVDELRRRFDERWEQHPWLVAEGPDGAVVGWAAAQQYGARPQYDGVAEFTVYVRPGQQRHGVGRALMTSLAREAAARGVHKLTSRVLAENTASRALLRSVGFGEVGVHHRHGRIDGRWHDVVVVELLLD